MNPGKVILVVAATVVIFAAGVITGGLLVRQTTRPPVPGGMPFLGRVEAVNRAVQQVELSPDQKQRVTEIIREGREQIADYFVILEPDVRQVFVRMRDQIRAELSPDQRRQFDEHLRRRQARAAERGGSTNPPVRRRDTVPRDPEP